MKAEIVKHEWKTWQVGMKLYVPYKKETRAAKGIECPICKGKRDLQEPFTGELYPCPGVVVRETFRHRCINGQIFPLRTLYKIKEYELESFTVKYPDENLNSVTLIKYNDDWLDEPSSCVHFSHKLEEMHFFKTEKEAQEYCDKMNQKMENCVNEL